MTAPSKRKAKTSPESEGKRRRADWPPVEPGAQVVHLLSAKYLLTKDEMRQQVKQHRWPNYVYGLCDSSGAVFYIGKGVGSRALEHEREAAKGADSRKCRAIRAYNDRLRYTIFVVCEDETYAAGYEALLIRQNLGVLTNEADGSTAAIERMFAPPVPKDPCLKALADLNAALNMLDEMAARTERDARRHVALYPWTAKDLFPDEVSA